MLVLDFHTEAKPLEIEAVPIDPYLVAYSPGFVTRRTSRLRHLKRPGFVRARTLAPSS
jgi:hypothetical protein